MCLFVAPAAQAQLDTGKNWSQFGPDIGNGAFVNITRHHLTNQLAYGIAVDPQNRVLVLNEWVTNGADKDCAVTRHINRARALDMGYTGPEELEGTRRIAMNMGGTNYDLCTSIASDSESRAVVAGIGDYGSGFSGFVVRLNDSGDYDTTFSADGKFALKNLAALAGVTSRLSHVQVDSSNRVLACGSVDRGTDRNMIALRIRSNGLIDTTFGTGGIVELDFNGIGGNDACARLLILPDGDVMLAGTSTDASGVDVYGFARLTPNGSLDTSFSSDGKLRLSTGSQFAATPVLADIAYDANRARLMVGCGLVYAAGFLRTGCVLAIKDNGVLDATFDGDGRRTLKFSDFVLDTTRESGGTRLRRLLLRDDGAMYLLGTHENSATDAGTYGTLDVVSMRMEADGSVVTTPDGPSTYGDRGVVFHSFSQVRQKYVPSGNYNYDVGKDKLAHEVLVDATWYRGNLLLLADRSRYRDSFYFDHDNDGNFDEPGPSAPLVANVSAEHLFGTDFEFDGIDAGVPGFAVPISVPIGYGNYCSVSNPSSSSNYGLLPQGAGSDPCQVFLDGNPNLVIERAGLYSIAGINQVIGTCSGGFITLRIDTGTAPFDQALADSVGRSGCVFTGIPKELAIFSRPYTGNHLAEDAQSFNHDPYGIPIDVSEFGQEPGVFDACAIDNRGRQRSEYDPHIPGQCQPTGGVDEPASDILVSSSRMTVAMALGWVTMAVPRHVPVYAPVGKDPYQREVFVRHQVGTGRYAESFTAYYAHMQDTAVRRGAIVNTGSVLGRVGDTGASTAEHLHIGVHRHRNLSWRRSFEFDFSIGNMEGRPATVDPWGWLAPAGVDPWAWRFRSAVPDNDALDNSGSFSSWMWKSGEAPTMN